MHPHLGFVSPKKSCDYTPACQSCCFTHQKAKSEKKMSNCHRGCQSKKMEKLLLRYTYEHISALLIDRRLTFESCCSKPILQKIRQTSNVPENM